MTSPDLRRWIAFGTGIGIEIAGPDLHVLVTKVRPSGARILGTLSIPGFEEKPAAEWGATYSEFIKTLGASHLAASVMLRREDVIVRQVAFPGVADRDLAGAVELQLETLHPYGEDEVISDWTRLGNSPVVEVVIVRRALIEKLTGLFAEAGIRIASFTCSAASIYSALRLVSTPPAEGFLALVEQPGGWEAYGESPSRPVFSALFDGEGARAGALALAELRLPPEAEVRPLSEMLPAPKAAPPDTDLSRISRAYATALAGACPRLALPVNLLPAEQRSSGSHLIFIPSIVLGVLLLVTVVAMAMVSPIEDRTYVKALQAEIAHLEPAANRIAKVDREIASKRADTLLLDAMRRRSRFDLDALAEMTHILQPPTFLTGLELTRTSVNIGGEADQAAALLKLIDNSPMFENSQFTQPPTRSQSDEIFRIRSQRQGATE